MRRGLAALLGLFVLSQAAASGGAIGSEAGAAEWNFRVYLDDNEIGYHHYRIVDDGAMQKVISEAEFEVKFLFITAYRYEHYNEETWRGECVAEISSMTDANGERFRVEGRRIGNRLEVSGRGFPSVCASLSRFRLPGAGTPAPGQCRARRDGVADRAGAGNRGAALQAHGEEHGTRYLVFERRSVARPRVHRERRAQAALRADLRHCNES